MATAVALSPSHTTHQSSSSSIMSPSSSVSNGSHPLAASAAPSSSPRGRAQLHEEEEESDPRRAASPIIAGSTHRGWLTLAAGQERLASPITSSRLDADEADALRQHKPKWAKNTASSATTTGAMGERRPSGVGYPYPALNEEAREAEAIEQNLERWAAEERQRRRALRASRSGSMLGGGNGKLGVSSSSSLARRLSTLGRSAKASSDKLPSSTASSGTPLSALSPTATASSNDLLRRSSHTDSLSSAGDSDDKNSFTGSSGRTLDASLLHDVPEHQDSTESSIGGVTRIGGGATGETAAARSSAKGKARALESSFDGSEDSRWDPPSAAEQRRLASDSYSAAARIADPFRDEASATSPQQGKRTSTTYAGSPASVSSNATATRGMTNAAQSGEATPRHPIVTPGRAPTIRHRAQQAGTHAPQIVATDVDSAQQSETANPFVSSAEAADAAATAGAVRYAMRHGGSSYGTQRRRETTEPIAEEDEDMSSPQSGAPRLMDPVALPRKSTSSSRFNEVGLHDEDEETQAWSTRGAVLQQQTQQVEQRKTWWTDWLCGCSSHVDDDQQTGKTGPDLV